MEGEGNLGSPGQSSEEHRISILRKAFDVYDVDGSGAIDYAEFKKLLQDLGWPSYDEFLDRAVRVLDQDFSGEIDFSEFLKWTQFAYVSRILYRHDMYGTGPRYTATDEGSLQPVVDQSQDGKIGHLIRRSSLSTVFEGREYVARDTSQSAYEPGEANDECMSESDGGADSAFRSGTSSNSSDIDNALSGRTKHSGSRGRESLSSNKGRSDRFRGQPPIQEAKPIHEATDVETSNSKKDESNEKQKQGQDSIRVREMASMVLSPCRRGMKVHPSRSRSKSAGLLSNRRGGRRDPPVREQTEVHNLGPRTESKITVRLRWACGQFRSAVVGDENQSESVSDSQGNEERNLEGRDLANLEESAKRSNNESHGTDVEDSVRRLQRHNRDTEIVDKAAASESYDELQEVNLRRIRSE